MANFCHRGFFFTYLEIINKNIFAVDNKIFILDFMIIYTNKK